MNPWRKTAYKLYSRVQVSRYEWKLHSLEKIFFTSLNYWAGSFFLPQLQNRAFRFPELLKPDTKPPCTACQAIEGGQNVPVTTCNPSWDSFSFPSEAGGWWVVRTCRCSRRIWWVSRGFRRPLLPQSAPGLWNRTPNESIRHRIIVFFLDLGSLGLAFWRSIVY